MHSNSSQGCPKHHSIQCWEKNSVIQIVFKRRGGEIYIEVDMDCSEEKMVLTVDTGAEISILKPDKILGECPNHHNEKITISGVTNSTRLSSIGRLATKIHIGEIKFCHDFHVMIDNRVQIKSDGILGTDFMFKYGANINFKALKFELQHFLNDDQVKKQENKEKTNKDIHFYDDFSGQFDKQITLKPIYNNFVISILNYYHSNSISDPNERARIILSSFKIEKLTDEQRHCLSEICLNFCEAFLLEGDVFRHTKVTEHFIELKPGTIPIFIRQYRIPECHKNEIEKKIGELETRGIIGKK